MRFRESSRAAPLALILGRCPHAEGRARASFLENPDRAALVAAVVVHLRLQGIIYPEAPNRFTTRASSLVHSGGGRNRRTTSVAYWSFSEDSVRALCVSGSATERRPESELRRPGRRPPSWLACPSSVPAVVMNLPAAACAMSPLEGAWSGHHGPRPTPSRSGRTGNNPVPQFEGCSRGTGQHDHMWGTVDRTSRITVAPARTAISWVKPVQARLVRPSSQGSGGAISWRSKAGPGRHLARAWVRADTRGGSLGVWTKKFSIPLRGRAQHFGN